MSRDVPLPAALAGERRTFNGPAGRARYYLSGPEHLDDEVPLLLVHSVNAAASAFEVKPIYDHYRASRPVIAIDLPGYGFSERPNIVYTPRLMTDTLHTLLAEIEALTGYATVDALALSLSCEFLARAASESPQRIRSLALISPTGFSGKQRFDGPPESTRGRAWLYKALAGSSRIGRGLFGALTCRPSVRFFLEKTWGCKAIDEGAFEYAWKTAHQPGARHAPFSFLSGYLFSADIDRVYETLSVPVWMAHGRRGDFTDYRRKTSVEGKPNWRFSVFDTGALPHFEVMTTFARDYNAFMSNA